MNPDDIQQIGRVLSILRTCQEKLETIMKNSGEGSPAYQVADNAAEWVSYASEEVSKTVSYIPSKEFR